MTVLMGVGCLLELTGFALAGRGLYVTWRDNAEGRRFWPPRLRRWVRKLLRRPPEVHSASGTSAATASFAASAYAIESVDPEAPVPEQIATLSRNIERAMRDASNAGTAIAHETRDRQRAVETLEVELRKTHENSLRFSRDLAVGGIPLAVVGLAFATIGLLLQLPASLFSG